MRSRVSFTYLIALAVVACASTASAWKFEDFVNPLGDTGTGITQVATNEPGIEFAFGCDGDRWRQVGLLPEGDQPLKLAGDGTVSIGFRLDRLSSDGKWKVRKVRGTNAYFAPAPTPLMGRLYREEESNPNAILYVKVRPVKKSPIVLQFPVAGLRRALSDHLWKQCKLDVYFGDPQ